MDLSFSKFSKNVWQRFDYIISRSEKRQLWALLILVVSVFFLIFVGSLLLHPLGTDESSGTRLWNTISNFLNPGTFTRADDGTGRIWVLLTGILGMIFLGGILISVISNMLERRIDKVRNGQVYYKFSDHIVIIGYDKMTVSLIKQLVSSREYSQCEIVIQTSREVPGVHHELFSNLKEDDEKKVVIVSGSRTSGEDLEKLRLPFAKEILLLGENDEYDHDSLNMECLKISNSLLKEHKSDKKRFHVLLEYQSTYAVFQQQDMISIKDHIDFVPFNFYESWAHKVFVDREYHPVDQQEEGENVPKVNYEALDRDGIDKDSDNGVHLVVIGMSSMGITLGVQAAHICHFPNYITKGIKTRITFIDDNADREMNFLKGRYRYLFEEVDYCYQDIDTQEVSGNVSSKTKFTDIRFEFIKGRVENPKIQNLLAEWSREKNSLLTIAVCFSSSPIAIACGLYLPNEVYDNEIPVLVRQETSHYMVSCLSLSEKQGDYRKYKNVRPFGMLDSCYDLSNAESEFAKLVNYAYDYFYARAKDKDKNKDLITAVREIMSRLSFDDSSAIDLTWNKLPTAKKWSNHYNVDSIQLKLKSLKNWTLSKELSDEDIEMLARVEHNRWNIEKLLMGYRPTSNEENKLIEKEAAYKDKYRNKFVHYDIRPYDDLQKDNDGINAREFDICISAVLPLIFKRMQSKK